jgi:hypothetical protein
MSPSTTKQEWDVYVAHEATRIQPLLERVGFSLDELQPQTIGERYLTRPVGGGRKVVFFGRRNSNGMRVVIKTSSETNGVAELALEQRTRDMLRRIRFAYGVFSLPEELIFNETEGVLITEYIDQEKPFLDRPLKEQFTIALDAFKAQEGVHATTTEHAFEVADYYVKAGEYKKIGVYAQDIADLLVDDAKLYAKLDALLDNVIEIIRTHEETLDRYSGFLTHWDFMPQNFRIRDGNVYLLDLTSVRFGNKYEGWARFINFMTLYNPPLAGALVEYVHLNRTDEELLSLKLMRVYRLVELIRYYATWLSHTQGDTRELARARIAFWTEVLDAVLKDSEVPDQTIKAYKAKRDSLRSDDEKRRQKDLH